MRTRLIFVSLAALALAACCNSKAHEHDTGGAVAMTHHENMWESVNSAVAVIYPTKGSSISGTITVTKEAIGDLIEGVKRRGRARLAAEQKHAHG